MSNLTEETEHKPYERPQHEGGHFIRAWRTFKEMTMTKLAEKAGLTTSMIGQLERGRAAYTQNNLTKIAGALDCEPWQLLAYDPKEPPQPGDGGVEELGYDFWGRFEDADREKVCHFLTTNYDHTVKLAVDLFAKGHKDTPDDS